MKLGGSKQEQRQLVTIAVLGTLLLGVYVVSLLKPLAGAVVRTGKEAQTAKTQLQHIELAIAGEPQLRRDYEQLSQKLQSLRTSLPSEEGMPAIIELLSDLASQTGLKIRTIFPQRTFESLGLATSGQAAPTTKAAELYKEIPIQIDAWAGYHQLGLFLSHVEAVPQPMELRSLRISADPKEPRRHNMKVVIAAYFATTPQRGAPSASAAGGGGS